MNRANWREYARIQANPRYLEETQIRFRVLADKCLKSLAGNAFRPPNGNMRVKGFKIGFEPGVNCCILNAPVQEKEVRMPFPHTRPHNRRLAANVENPDTA